MKAEEHGEILFMAQRVFRLLLNAMSRPGTIYEMNPAVGKWNRPVPGMFGDGDIFLVSILTTLLDGDVSFCAAGDTAEAVRKIAEFTGARISAVGEADFVIVPPGGKINVILDVKRGTPKYPDEGATIIFCAERLCGDDCPGVRLKGPGIADVQRLSVTGIDPGIFAYLTMINSEFPLGVDSFFVDTEGRLAAIPRSTAIEVKGWDTQR